MFFSPVLSPGQPVDAAFAPPPPRPFYRRRYYAIAFFAFAATTVFAISHCHYGCHFRSPQLPLLFSAFVIFRRCHFFDSRYFLSPPRRRLSMPLFDYFHVYFSLMSGWLPPLVFIYFPSPAATMPRRPRQRNGHRHGRHFRPRLSLSASSPLTLSYSRCFC